MMIRAEATQRTLCIFNEASELQGIMIRSSLFTALYSVQPHIIHADSLSDANATMLAQSMLCLRRL